MFEAAELGRKIDKEAYDARVPELRTELLRIQNQLKSEAPFSVVLVIGGVDGAGKGETVNTLHEWMDPRYLIAHAFGPRTDEERERPPTWRYWRALPPRGRIGVFFGSWYTEPIIRHVYGRCTDDELETQLGHIKDFEKMLVEDGTLVLKYWFHLSKSAQKKRLKSLSKDPKQSWRVGPTDWKHFGMYDDFIVTSERALRETSTAYAPWQVIEGADARYRHLTTGEHVLESLQTRLSLEPARLLERTQTTHPPPPLPRDGQPTILDAMDLSARLEKDAYEAQLLEWQGRLNRLSRKAQKAGATMLCVFEGQDAAGKGGAIRRITRALDARYYQVVQVAAPSDEEAAHHYLWRFWRQLPRAGHMTIFDRSWYGRVLVERVEGFATVAEWQRAYNEITEFEQLLSDSGIGLVKFWLQIDQDEQQKRFKQRANTSYKEFKITDEDYRNREKWPLYEDAVHEMVARTSSEFAPWTLVPANDKRYARIQVLKTTCAALEQCVKRATKRKHSQDKGKGKGKHK